MQSIPGRSHQNLQVKPPPDRVHRSLVVAPADQFVGKGGSNVRNIPSPGICKTMRPMRNVAVDMATSLIYWRRGWASIFDHGNWQGCEAGFSSLALQCRLSSVAVRLYHQLAMSRQTRLDHCVRSVEIRLV